MVVRLFLLCHCGVNNYCKRMEKEGDTFSIIW